MIAAAQAREAADMFNRFMKLAGDNKDLRITKVRHTVRAPEVEIFSRKLIAALVRAVPSVVTRVEDVEGSRSGLNTFAAMAIDSGLRTLDMKSANPVEVYCLLAGSAIRVWASRYSTAPAFAHSPVTVASGVTSGLNRPELESAADSVFLQTFADVYAIAKLAATQGNVEAVRVLDFVLERRRDSGDFSLYSLAPLSHDTRRGLELLGGRLSMNLDFSDMTGEELIQECTELTRSALRSWLESQGISPHKAAQLQDSIALLERQLCTIKPAPAIKQTGDADSSRVSGASPLPSPGTNPGSSGLSGARLH